ncbi:NAD-dependent epimerase/dehydratase family protein [Streptomyces rectiverticillatus]|uniref:NAD-dependent epimerase/dehydratase family protein n=1 Tax=Streptomyces rectiverticillatus TaxID=173860 RepID=UPI0015C2C920|nr:NAD-dependent epimerase/dehydratase family protein [Streptomyces rectiverticillatus]QLE75537.1 NAD-dependent epimerase/dehydratase family protein [Streptomyces rectiverticillatus]
MRYAVTGATGFIGTRLVAHLTALGHDVTALVRDPRRPVPGTRTETVDLVTGTGLRRATADADVVVHLAALTHAADLQALTTVNTGGTRRLVAALAAQPHPPRLVYCSSLAASGPGRLRHENDPPAPVSAYGRSKLGGEQALREADTRLPALTVRPPIVYGPGDRHFLPHLAAAARTGLLPAVGRRGPRRYSLLHVDDLCRALLAAAESGTPGAVYHAGDGTEHLWSDIGAAVAAAMGRRPPRVVHLPVPLALAAARTLGRTGILNPDKVGEARHPSWTTAPGSIPSFTPRITWPDGLRSILSPAPLDFRSST